MVQISSTSLFQFGIMPDLQNFQSLHMLRHHYMKDVNIFVAEPGDLGATLAVSALARAMKEMDRVAIVRCVWRQGQGNVVIGVLTPNLSNSDIIVSTPILTTS